MTDTSVPPEESTFSLETLNAHRGALPERMGIEVLEASPGKVVARMPVEGNTQPYGILHGGANVVLAETVGSIGSAIHAMRSGKISVGLDISATHHRAARSGWVTATATAITLGGSITCYEITITDDSGRRTCTSRLTCMLREQPPGA